LVDNLGNYSVADWPKPSWDYGCDHRRCRRRDTLLCRGYIFYKCSDEEASEVAIWDNFSLRDMRVQSPLLLTLRPLFGNIKSK
jgi:hypothetical protein